MIPHAVNKVNLNLMHLNTQELPSKIGITIHAKREKN